MGVPADRGVPVVDPFVDAKAEGEPFAEERVAGGREAFRRCKVFIGNLVLYSVVAVRRSMPKITRQLTGKWCIQELAYKKL
jgi:hypothetical protein